MALPVECYHLVRRAAFLDYRETRPAPLVFCGLSSVDTRHIVHILVHVSCASRVFLVDGAAAVLLFGESALSKMCEPSECIQECINGLGLSHIPMGVSQWCVYGRFAYMPYAGPWLLLSAGCRAQRAGATLLPTWCKCGAGRSRVTQIQDPCLPQVLPRLLASRTER